MTSPASVLLIQSSARREGSVSRRLAADLAARLGGEVTLRDLADDAPLIDAAFVAAKGGADVTSDAVAASDAMIAELVAADAVVIGAPIYNFGAPAALKAWFDLIARPGLAFRYTENGPEGLLTGKTAYVVIASDGVGVGGEMDFFTPWMRFVLGFVGITDVRFIAADQLMFDTNAEADARAEIAALPLAA